MAVTITSVGGLLKFTGLTSKHTTLPILNGVIFLRDIVVIGGYSGNKILFQQSADNDSVINVLFSEISNKQGQANVADYINYIVENEWVNAKGSEPSLAKSVAYETNRVVKASAGTLFAIWGYNSSASAQFIQVHNTATLPADTAIPIITFNVAAGANFFFDLSGAQGVICSTGITLCNSSTGPTKTIGSANVWFNAIYK